MKKIIFTLLLLTSIGLISCRKTGNDPNITQYDQIQIQNYITANGLSAMKRDTTDGDTSGIYYQTLAQSPNTTHPLDYPDSVAFVFTLKSFDGKYTSLDSLSSNHYNNYVGHIASAALPKGLQIAVRNLIKYRGSSARVLIPSRLAYGVNGYGSGSSSNANSHIAGNQSLDYYVNIIDNLDDYDQFVIKKYMATNSITGFTEVTSGRGKGLWYKVTTEGTGPDQLTYYSAFTATYSGKYLTNTVFDAGLADGSASSFASLDGLVPGVQEALKGHSAGTVISMILPSRLAYARGGSSSGGIAPNTCMRFDFTIATVTTP
ncbi:FKBP-type peptidyl-prolyl cis-trans isomerase [Mucilaginibacter pineti]|uniref:Peptidyl-prolyl cis-trans isomerase n=1 Tax=Mucilaginibacter pineti TaxID=1391627 RepID=A0A1G7CTT7_9SPHI|nr:FKBP-type peptidyl-prolyl cis-trans isomerase [Mucilaginibacter pineti]SDE42641.1 FKBP-type peptidyl-prolyl cis-trans isomerase [Mucilaginibacter pineti]